MSHSPARRCSPGVDVRHGGVAPALARPVAVRTEQRVTVPSPPRRGAVRADLEEVFRDGVPAGRRRGGSGPRLPGRGGGRGAGGLPRLRAQRGAGRRGDRLALRRRCAHRAEPPPLRPSPRRPARRPRAPSTTVAPDVADAVVTLDERRRVRAALARLPQQAGRRPRPAAQRPQLRRGRRRPRPLTRQRRHHRATRRVRPTQGAEPSCVIRLTARCAGSWTSPTASPTSTASTSRAARECLSGLAAAQEDAALTAAAARRSTSTPDVDAAWQRLSHATGDAERARASGAGAAAPAAGGPGCAARWSPRSGSSRSWPAPVRRPPRTGCRSSGPSGSPPVSITESDLVDLPDLSAYGDVEVDRRARRPPGRRRRRGRGGHRPDRPAGRRAAARGDGRPHLPGRRPAAGAVHLLRRRRRPGPRHEPATTLPPPPPGLDGSQFRLTAGPGLAAVWSASSRPAGAGGRASRRTDGVLLGHPVRDRARLPALAARPAGPASPTSCGRCPTTASTLPLPLPADQVTSSTADVGGVPATVFTVEGRHDGRCGLGRGRRRHRGGRHVEHGRGAVGRTRAAVTAAPAGGRAAAARRAAGVARGVVLRACASGTGGRSPSTGCRSRSAAAR